jgi:pyrroloquinoline-quinone synthase
MIEFTTEGSEAVTFWESLAAACEPWDVLRHPFYRRWSSGELEPAELAAYSGQYRHAVVALAEASRTAASSSEGSLREHFSRHAREEAGHVELWDRFTSAAGGDPAAGPAPETSLCADAWAGERRSPVATLAALYAIESAQPAIAEVKCRGLVEHYGFELGPATDYFTVHSTRDHDHAASHRRLLEAELERADRDELIGAARDALVGNWALLDGVERLVEAA